MAFCDRLRGLIEEREITQKELANLLRVPASTLGGYVQGTSEPDFGTLSLLARFFQVSTDYLLEVPGQQTHAQQEEELLRVFRSLTPEQQELYLEQGRAFLRVKARRAKG